MIGTGSAEAIELLLVGKFILFDIVTIHGLVHVPIHTPYLRTRQDTSILSVRPVDERELYTIHQAQALSRYTRA